MSASIWSPSNWIGSIVGYQRKNLKQRRRNKTMLQRVLKQGLDSLSIIGLAKNVGKTTVLNGLVAEAHEKEISVGLVSIGVDGEERDVWSGRLKPPVYVPAGSFVATAGPLLDLEGYSWEVIAETGVQSAVGKVLIARA